MSHYSKILFSALFVLSTLSLSANAQTIVNESAMASSACNASGFMMDDDSDCRVTPSTFSTTIYEIGLCTAHPYGAVKTSATFDASTCVVIYTDAAPAAVDLAAAIGTNTALPGTASAPPEGTYGFPYIKLGTDFTRSIDTDKSGNPVICNKSDRLVAVMNLAAPFTVTSQTYAVNFNFILTNYGGQFVDGNDGDRIPEEFASAPFAGYFTVLNAD